MALPDLVGEVVGVAEDEAPRTAVAEELRPVAGDEFHAPAA
jgi:hypothetical protein